MLFPGLMVHLDLFSVAADASRATMASAAQMLPWNAIRWLSDAARCEREPQPLGLLDRFLLRGALPESQLSLVCSYVRASPP